MAEFNPDEFIKQYGDKPAEKTGGRESTAANIRHGFEQGLLDPVEGLGQIVEHLTGVRLGSDELRRKLREFRDNARGSQAGVAAEIVGNILNPANIVPGAGVARGAGLAARGLGLARSGLTGLASRAATEGFLPGAAVGAMQPVQGDDFSAAKWDQATAGGLAGLAAGGTSAAAGAWPALRYHGGHFWPALIAGASNMGRVAARNVTPLATPGGFAGAAGTFEGEADQ